MILIASFPKTGVHWTKFVICNYTNILQYGMKSTLTFKQLDSIFKNPISLHHTHIPLSGHLLFNEIKNVHEYYNKFDKIIYQMRNPYDTMISFWHYLKNRDPPFSIIYNKVNMDLIDQFSTLKGFTEFFLPLYIDHIESTRNKADLVLNYDELRKDPNEFKKVIKLIFDEVDEEVFKKTIEMSSFENIRKMGIETNQQHGLAKDYLGHFARDGRSGQFKEVMDAHLVQYIETEWNKHF